MHQTVIDVDAAFAERFECELERTIDAAVAASGGTPLTDHLRWHFGGPRKGKRLRPRLALCAALDAGGTDDDVLDAALAVELLHNYSLVHDDIEDRDEERHGRRTVWAHFGLAHGINAGDAISALATLTLLGNRAGVSGERLACMALTLHRVHWEMCSGQAYDLAFETAPRVTLAQYTAMIEGKTAALFGGACELGAQSGSAEPAQAAAYRALGRAYGRAFQIRDDLAGTWATREETGKARGGDVARRKWTFPVVWALGGAPSPLRSELAAHYGPQPHRGPDADAAVVALLERLGAREAAEAAYRAQLDAARELARTAGIDDGGRIAALFESGFRAAGARGRSTTPAPAPRS